MHVCECAYVHACAHARTHVHMYASVITCVCEYVYMHVRICTHVCMHVRVCVCTCEHVSLFRGSDMGGPRIDPTGLPLGLPELTGNARGARAPAGSDHRCAVCLAASSFAGTDRQLTRSPRQITVFVTLKAHVFLFPTACFGRELTFAPVVSGSRRLRWPVAAGPVTWIKVPSARLGATDFRVGTFCPQST